MSIPEQSCCHIWKFHPAYNAAVICYQGCAGQETDFWIWFLSEYSQLNCLQSNNSERRDCSTRPGVSVLTWKFCWINWSTFETDYQHRNWKWIALPWAPSMWIFDMISDTNWDTLYRIYWTPSHDELNLFKNQQSHHVRHFCGMFFVMWPYTIIATINHRWSCTLPWFAQN